MVFFNTFIVPVLIVLAMSAVFSFILSFFGTKFAVERDARIDSVEAKLAGVNCGGCGYSGCAAFAEALINGDANLSMCKPTSKSRKDEIASILGIVNSGEETVAVVKCNGGNRCQDKFDYQGYGDCQTSELLAGGNKECSVACMGRGTCSDECRFDAISDKNDTGHAIVDDLRCTSCGACVTACPKDIISFIPRKAKVYVACSSHCTAKEVMDMCTAGCIGCSLCVKVCEAGAITMADNLPVFDYSKCTSCMACAEKCPRKVIIAKK